jgi:hypothetical protein
MSTPDDEAESAAWHKRFAASCNNLAWDLATQPRTKAQDQEMLDAAHASAWHWGRVGTELNRMRAQMLLAEVHALLGLGTSAFRLAEGMREYFLGRDDTPAWELAFTHAIYAHAAYAAQRPEEHRRAHGEAVAALQALADPEDREMVEKTFSQVPAP